ncbi:MAG: MiaB/RimO family radical SAM methylthiotransferase [Coriobacteriales bacterium]|jgi:threonylcarbamoyladenosine tRNA methylthiotransferase MtaB|nr:MiaB/RimO family radical SAM methylthiotransferase [Coriobacteriales bacterium]
MMRAEFFVNNLGCKLNRVESDTLSAALLAAGGLAVARDEADVVIVNTCAVTGEAETKTRKAIRQALAGPRKPWVIATGCAIALSPASYEALGTRVLAKPERPRAQAIALELLGLSDSSGPNSSSGASGLSDSSDSSEPSAPSNSAPAHKTLAKDFHVRKGIKIQDGCDNSCSYCVVRLARGASRSLPPDEIREQVRAAERTQTPEIILTGVDIGSYRNASLGLCELLEQLLNMTKHPRIRLSSLEPQHASDELLQLMATSRGRLCAHLHLPLQSGCDQTLAAMARLYDSSFYEERVTRARALMPQLALTTDLMVGFPGENDEDFDESLRFCERMGFAKAHIFRYSKRPNTPAAARADQIAPPVRAERARILRQCTERAQQRDARSRVGTEEIVVVERPERGMSESYHRVALPRDYETGELIGVRFIGYRDNLLQVAAS